MHAQAAACSTLTMCTLMTSVVLAKFGTGAKCAHKAMVMKSEHGKQLRFLVLHAVTDLIRQELLDLTQQLKLLAVGPHQLLKRDLARQERWHL